MGGKEGTREVCGEKVTDTASVQTVKLFFQELKNFCGYSISWKVDQTQKTAIADDADSVNSSLMQDQW